METIDKVDIKDSKIFDASIISNTSSIKMIVPPYQSPPDLHSKMKEPKSVHVPSFLQQYTKNQNKDQNKVVPMKSNSSFLERIHKEKETNKPKKITYLQILNQDNQKENRKSNIQTETPQLECLNKLDRKAIHQIEPVPRPNSKLKIDSIINRACNDSVIDKEDDKIAITNSKDLKIKSSARKENDSKDKIKLQPFIPFNNSENSSEFNFDCNEDDFLYNSMKNIVRNKSFKEKHKKSQFEENDKRRSIKTKPPMLSMESPCFGMQKLRFDKKRLSKMTQDDIRSIRIIDYSPTLRSSKEGAESPVSKNLIKTMNTFRLMHKEEAEKSARCPSQSKSSKEVKLLSINLIPAIDSKKTPEKRDSFNPSMNKWRNSNISIEAQVSRSSLKAVNSNTLGVDQLISPLKTPSASGYDIHNSAIETIEENSMSMSSVSQGGLENSKHELSKVEESAGSPSIHMKSHITNKIQKKETNPITIKSHTSTLSKKTGETKTGTGPRKPMNSN